MRLSYGRRSLCYAYDADGNLSSNTTKVVGALTGGVTAYSWDAEDHLIRIDFADLTLAAYHYDGLGRRIEKNVNDAITRYAYDGDNVLLEYDGRHYHLASVSYC